MDNQPNEAKLNFGPFEALVVAVGSFFASQLFAVFAVSLVLGVLGWNELRLQTWFDETTASQAILIGLSGIFSVALVSWFLKSRGNNLKQLGLGRPKFASIGQALLGFTVYFIALIAIVTALKALIPALNLEHEQELGLNFGAESNIALLIFSLVVIPPLVEEIVMRGLLFGGLRTRLSFWIAALVTSLIFAAAHLPAGKDGLLWVAAIDTFILSVVLCYLREKTGSLWPSILGHAMKNGIALRYLVQLG